MASEPKTAEMMSGSLREISVAEFFEKNRHLLGFDNPAKALLTVVKEAVDNSLDACEEARILPEIVVIVREPREIFVVRDDSGAEIGRMTKLGDKIELMIGDEKAKFIEKKEPRKIESVFIFEHDENTYKFRLIRKETSHKDEKGGVIEGVEDTYEFVRGRTELKVSKQPADRFTIIVEDNGPGIAKEHVPRVFGKLLYGSKFAGGKQGRGQQGIGISAAVLYAQLTAGKPAIVHVRTAPNKPVYQYHVRIDTTKNEPIIVEEKSFKEVPPLDGLKTVMKEHGIRFEAEVEGKWIQRYHSVEEYLRQTAISSPYAHLIYQGPDDETVEFPRVIKELPPLATPIKPHPHGVEMGALERMTKLTDARSISGFLSGSFSRVGSGTATEICRLAGLKPGLNPKQLDHQQLERLYRTLQNYPFMKPPMDCLSPISEDKFMAGLQKEYKIDYIAATTRPPAVYRGNPFQIEVVMGYGGALPTNQGAKIMRFANRVPLLYQASSCATMKAMQKIDWRHYSLDQAGGLPVGPLVIAIHMASVWIPYVSEAKEAIDPYQIIIKEMKLALQDCARKMQHYISGKHRREEAAQRVNLFEKYIPEVADALSQLTGTPKAKIQESLTKTLKKGKVLVEAEPAPEIADAEKPIHEAVVAKEAE